MQRRDVLGLLGATAANSALWALGCGAPTVVPRRPPQVSGEVRTWLHDAVSRLAARYPLVHALAVSRRRTTAARDVIGAGIAQLRSDGVVLTVRDRDGTWREYATAQLTRDGVAAAARALDAPRQSRDLDFGRPPTTPDEPPRLDHDDLPPRLDRLLRTSPALAPRIVYAAAMIDIDDAITWSVSPGRDREQRLVRIRNTAVRAAWSDTRPAVRHVERAWSGWLDDQRLTADDLDALSEAALEIMTPGDLFDDERTVVLDPSVAAIVFDAVARGLFTSTAARRPEVARRFAPPGASHGTDAPATTAGPSASPATTAGPSASPATTAGPSASPATTAGASANPATTAGASANPAGPTPSSNSATASAVGPRPSSTGATASPASPVKPAADATATAAPFASPLVTLIDDPTTAGAYGGFTFDDEGEPATAITLVDAGRIVDHLADRASGRGGRGRRPGHLGPVLPAPSHLRLVPGTTPLTQLFSDGFLLEGGLGASLAPGGDRIRVLCARARELKAGRPTGQIYANVELVASLAALLSAIDAVADTPTSFAPHGPPTRDPLWTSISTPALRTRALLRTARSRSTLP